MADLGNRLNACEKELKAAGYSGQYLEIALRPFEVAAKGGLYAKVQATRRKAERETGEKLPACLEKRLDNLYVAGILQNGPTEAQTWYNKAVALAMNGYNKVTVETYANRAQRIAEEAGIKFTVDWDQLYKKSSNY